MTRAASLGLCVQVHYMCVLRAQDLRRNLRTHDVQSSGGSAHDHRGWTVAAIVLTGNSSLDAPSACSSFASVPAGHSTPATDRWAGSSSSRSEQVLAEHGSAKLEESSRRQLGVASDATAARGICRGETPAPADGFAWRWCAGDGVYC
ncbi:hypothetical protein C6341_g15131 [Phytophthora cactorum]|uniref:Uncharacterized protein n=1 Tax=Phytophthora cactorum TaxID=29920 RepID=A0A8T1EEY3_9STRA|nr:hypothetical protein PC117_g3895 [Phytophthora cactorum]KAG3156255.1 hypothetical protein C6341_g15131 [Phytophthora cactorum]